MSTTPAKPMASFPKVLFQGPMNLDGYNRSLPAIQQRQSIPLAFIEVMEVREGVFVKEQGVPILIEADSDDPRCCHWVAYDVREGQDMAEPVGTIRLVPFPHQAHPKPGDAWDVDDLEEAALLPTLEPKQPPFIIDRATSLHDGKEPYVKFGRLAVLKEFRGKGIADLLVNTAMQWVVENPTFFNQAIKGMDPKQTKWNGLICVHAQTYVEKAWAKWGFVVDEGMGTWTEAELPHVGMFQRVNIKRSS